MVAPVTPVETGTPVDPGNASGDELQRLSKIPGGAAGCRLAAGALTSCDASRAFFALPPARYRRGKNAT
jgi:hypothetical protein